MANVELRGAAFHSFLDALREVRGEATRERVIEALPAGFRERIRSGAIVGIGWYPLSDYALFYDALDEVTSGSDALAKTLGAATAERDTRGFLRYVLSLSTPEFLLRHADRVILSYLRGVTSRLEEVSPGRASLVLEHFVGSNARIHAEWAGGIEFVLSRCGAKSPRVAWESSADFETVTYRAGWDR